MKLKVIKIDDNGDEHILEKDFSEMNENIKNAIKDMKNSANEAGSKISNHFDNLIENIINSMNCDHDKDSFCNRNDEECCCESCKDNYCDTCDEEECCCNEEEMLSQLTVPPSQDTFYNAPVINFNGDINLYIGFDNKKDKENAPTINLN